MKRLFLTWTLCCAGIFALPQSDNFLESVNRDRLQRQKTGMLVLGGWAAGNIATGLILRGKTEGPARHFHTMNAGWNAVNLIIAGFGYYGAMNGDPTSLDLYQTVQEQHKFQKILLFNAGLDVGYMAAGLYLIERSRRGGDKADQYKGFGRSIILQGGFLFAFDLVNYFIHASHNEDLQPLMSSLRFDGQNLGFVLTF